MIDGLSPATVYEVNPTNTQFFDTVRTAPTSGVKLGALSDYHVSGYASGSPMQELGDKISAEEPDLILLNGDLVDDNGLINATQATRWSGFVKGLSNYFRSPSGALLPVFATIGNHDGAGAGNTGAGAYWQGTGTPGAIQEFFSFGFAEAHPNRFADGAAWFGVGSHLLMVTVDTDHCTPLPDQRAWFANLLATKAATFDHIEIAGHVPPFGAASEEIYEFPTQSREFRNHFWTEMQQYPNVRHMLTGHLHVLHVTPPISVNYDDGLETATPGANDLRFETGSGPRQLGSGPWGGVRATEELVGAAALLSSIDSTSYIEAMLHFVDNAYAAIGSITNPSDNFWHGWVIEFGAVNVTATAISRTAGAGPFYQVVDAV